MEYNLIDYNFDEKKHNKLYFTERYNNNRSIAITDFKKSKYIK